MEGLSFSLSVACQRSPILSGHFGLSLACQKSTVYTGYIDLSVGCQRSADWFVSDLWLMVSSFLYVYWFVICLPKVSSFLWAHWFASVLPKVSSFHWTLLFVSGLLKVSGFHWAHLFVIGLPKVNNGIIYIFFRMTLYLELLKKWQVLTNGNGCHMVHR